MTVVTDAVNTRRPVTILSGFLGSGKTTLLNNLLKADHGLRIVVMVNDFGDVNVDKDLVQGQDGNLLELTGGCLCCTIRDDLLGAAQELIRSGREFDCVIVETSGLAEPSAVAKTFLVPELEQHFRLDAVVAVIDGANIGQWLQRNEVAAEQVRYADLLVVNKLDLLDLPQIDDVKAQLAALNPHARMLPAMYADVPHELLLDIDAHRESATGDGFFTSLQDGAVRPAEGNVLKMRRRRDARHEKVLSFSFAADIELDYDAFDQFVQSLPDGIYRAKGTLALAGLRRRVIFHRVGGRNVLDQGSAWAEGETRACRVMFLGEGYDGDAVLDQLRACRREGSVDIAFADTLAR